MSDRGATRDFASGLNAGSSSQERWLSVYEVAAMTLQHADTVRRWIAEGALESEDRGRLGPRVREREVERFLRDAFQTQGRTVADHGLSSNVVAKIPSPSGPSERVRAGAGWPFNRRTED